MKRFCGESLDALEELQRVTEDLVLRPGQREASLWETRNPVVKNTVNGNVVGTGDARWQRAMLLPRKREKQYQRTGNRIEPHWTERKRIRSSLNLDLTRKKNGCAILRFERHLAEGVRVQTRVQEMAYRVFQPAREKLRRTKKIIALDSE